MDAPTIGDMTKEELEAMITREVRRQITIIRANGDNTAPVRKLRSPLELPVLDIPWHEGLSAMSREDYYGEDGR
jgi:hypothetical protein